MQCSVCGELDLPVEGQPADACTANGQYSACAQDSCITVCYLPKLDLEPLVLSSSCLPCASLHIQPCGIRQLGLSRCRAPSLPHTQQQTLLAAATPSGVLLWILEDAYAAAADNKPVPAPLRLLDPEQSGPSLALTMSAGGGSGGSSSEAALLAVGCGCVVLVWDLRQLEVAYRLEGHTAAVSALTFSPAHQQLLVTAAEDRTFKVWDLQAGQMLYQSSILGAAVPTCLAVDAAAARLAMGCADGSVRQFDFAQLPACREMQVLDLSKAVQQIAAAAASAAAAAERSLASGPKTISAASAGAVQSLRQQMQELISRSGTAGGSGSSCSPASAAELLPEAQSEGSGCVLGMQFVQFSGLLDSSEAADAHYFGQSQYSSSQQHGLLQELLQQPPQLLVCTQRGLLLVNVATGDVERCCLVGAEASRVWDMLREADTAKVCKDNSSQRQPGEASRSTVPVSQLQQPSAQNQQLQARLAACFCALPDIEHPAAACCFAAPSDVQQEQFGPLEALCCLASGSSGSFSMLHIGQQDSGRSITTDSARSGAGGQQQQKQLSVFQTQPLPEGSPLLDRTVRSSSSSSAGGSSRPSSSTGSGVPLPRSSSKGSSSGSGMTISAAARPDQTSAAGNTSARVKQRATWQADSKAQPTAAAGAPARTAGKLLSASRAPASPKPKPKKALSDKPVTFHRQIKSSGYGFVQPKVKLGQAKPAPVKVGGPNASKVPQLLAQQLSGQRQYPLDAAAPGEWGLQPEQGLPGGQPVHNGGVLRLEYAGDGCRLLTAASDKNARCLWLPLAKHAGAGTTFVGHGGPVSAVSWSHSGELLLTASADRTAKLWNCSNPSAIVTFASEQQQQQISSISRSASSKASSNSGKVASSAALSRSSNSSRGSNSGGRGSSIRRTASSNGSSSSGVQQGFRSDVTAAQFFYVDQFVLLATGSKLHLYRYKLPDAAAEDDIERLKASGSYSLAGSYTSSCQTITDVAAANSFMSTLLLLACSNRSIQLVDAATMQVACSIPDAHARPVQRLVQPPASPFVSHPREVHELFASSAPDGVIKLWDVRSGSCVRSFTGHKNSQMPIGLAFSPCMRYLATGSEDKAAYVYDLRSCSMLGRLRPPGHTAEVVTDVAFHPWRPELVVGCMDGRVHCYADVY